MLHIDGLCKSYAGRSVLKPVSFFLPAGFCLGITGANGAGKSTLLRLIAQVEAPDSGTIRMNGRNVLGERSFLRTQVGYVPQQQGLMEDLTVRQQLKLWQSACGLHGALPEEVLELMGIRPLLEKQICTLSGGMKQRLSIAMALLNHPRILILDEAMSGLDEAYRGRFLAYLEGFLAEGGRILFCSHNTDELGQLCGSRLHLQDGCVVDMPADTP